MSLEDRINQDGDIDLTMGQEEVQNTNTEDDVIEVPDLETDNNIDTPEVPEEPSDPIEGEVPNGEQGDQSSLTQPQDPKEVEEPRPVQELEINDDVVTKYLSEKLGKDITSIEDLAKEPEKVENPLDKNPQLKEIYEWSERTNRPISDWIKFQKDYEGLSDLEVAREYLQYQYPDFTPEEIDLELSSYVAEESDLDSEVARKNLNLKKLAIDGKRELNKLKSEYDTPLPVQQASLTEDQQQRLDAFEQIKQQADLNRQKAEQYQQGIESTLSTIDHLPMELSEELNIKFTIPDTSKKDIKEFMQMKHWMKEDGTHDYEAILRDSYFVQNRESMLKLAYEQGVAKGKETEDVETRNITLDKSRKTMENAHTDSNQITVEGAEHFGSRTGAKIRFGKNY